MSFNKMSFSRKPKYQAICSEVRIVSNKPYLCQQLALLSGVHHQRLDKLAAVTYFCSLLSVAILKKTHRIIFSSEVQGKDIVFLCQKRKRSGNQKCYFKGNDSSLP